MKAFFCCFLIGEASKLRRLKYTTSTAEYFDTDNKAIILLKCSDDNYRFDFIKDKDTYKLAFMECITLPVSRLSPLPFSEFLPLLIKKSKSDTKKQFPKQFISIINSKNFWANRKH
jgi:hypothetical protein